MIVLRPFAPADLIDFPVQPGQRRECGDLDALAVELTRRGGEAITVTCESKEGIGGHPVMICGVVQHGDVGSAWAVLSEDAGALMLSLTRGTRHFFDNHDCATIVTTIDMTCAAFVRWAQLLGFEDRGMVQWQRDPSQHLFVREKA